jgi:hypothetical protein
VTEAAAATKLSTKGTKALPSSVALARGIGEVPGGGAGAGPPAGRNWGLGIPTGGDMRTPPAAPGGLGKALGAPGAAALGAAGASGAAGAGCDKLRPEGVAGPAVGPGSAEGGTGVAAGVGLFRRRPEALPGCWIDGFWSGAEMLGRGSGGVGWGASEDMEENRMDAWPAECQGAARINGANCGG